MFVFVFAMEKEASPLLKDCEILSEETIGFTRLIHARFESHEFLAGISGIGKAFASSTMTAICAHPVYGKSIEGVINVGIAGSLNKKKADLLSCVLGKECVEHDLDTSAIGDPVGMVSGINRIRFPGDPKLMEAFESVLEEENVPYCKAVISSGDAFLLDPKKKSAIVEEFGSLCLDMESAPFAQIAYVFKVPYLAVRFISDAEHPEFEYAQYGEEAAGRAANTAKGFLRKCA